MTAGCAVAEALQRLEARKIGLVSPYPPNLTEASVAYWRGHGLAILTSVRITNPENTFHSVYDLSAARVEEALASVHLKDTSMQWSALGTGMPTLGSISNHASASPVPILSCMSASWRTWRSLVVFDRKLGEARRDAALFCR